MTTVDTLVQTLTSSDVLGALALVLLLAAVAVLLEHTDRAAARRSSSVTGGRTAPGDRDAARTAQDLRARTL
ncbi:MAG: hypothetical protein ABIW80_15130 [Lapillicoccus sp.]